MNCNEYFYNMTYYFGSHNKNYLQLPLDPRRLRQRFSDLYSRDLRPLLDNRTMHITSAIMKLKIWLSENCP